MTDSFNCQGQTLEQKRVLRAFHDKLFFVPKGLVKEKALDILISRLDFDCYRQEVGDFRVAFLMSFGFQIVFIDSLFHNFYLYSES